jgi:hypothetical protein
MSTPASDAERQSARLAIVDEHIILENKHDLERHHENLWDGGAIRRGKEQTSGNVYGVRLAEQGFVVIVFDASFQGAREASNSSFAMASHKNCCTANVA